ncbi:MAG: glycosyltransferase [Candidatus Bathyarchaeota archaeon]|nr:glycosyltransferase [Candidatus Bathyarchaeota archaeon]
MSYPYVTIGICVKDSEDTIAECLQSVIRSDYPENSIELIVVDGLSNDHTLDLCKNILKQSIRHKLISDEGKGLGFARQLVVNNANGKYICWVDGDSTITKNFIKVQVKFLEHNPSVGVAIPVTFPKRKSIIERLDGYRWLIPTLNAIKKGKIPYLAMQGACLPVKVISDAGGFNKTINSAGEDIDLFLRIIKKGYRIRANSKAFVYHSMVCSFKGIFKKGFWFGSGSYNIFSFREIFYRIIIGFLLHTKSVYTIVNCYHDLKAAILMPFFNGTYYVGMLIGYFTVDFNSKF